MSVAGGPYPGAWKASNVRRLEGMVQAEDLPGELRFVAADIRSRPDMERLFGDAQGKV